MARRPVSDRHAADLHGEHGVELDDEHARGPPDAERPARDDESRRIQDPVPRRLRCVPVGDDRVRRSGAARHDVSRAPRRDVDARPADLGIRRSGRFGAHPGRAADGRVQAVPGSADRAGRAPRVSRVRPTRTARASSATIRTSSSTTRPSPGSGIGFLAGWRGKDGDKFMRGEPNPRQWEMYAKNNCVYHHKLPPSYQYMRNWNKGYLEWSQRNADPALRGSDPDPRLFRGAAEVPPRGAGQGHRRASRRSTCKERIADVLRSAAVLLRAARGAADRRGRYPLRAVTQRPMAMYHSWDSQNAWLRQIHAHNYLFVNPRVARAAGIDDGDWMWVESPWGRVRCMCRYSRGGRARHGLDLERDRQGRGRVASRAGRERVAARLPAQPPDRRRAARSRRLPHLQFGSGDRTGGVVRRPGAHQPRRGRRAQGHLAAVRAGAGRRPGPRRRDRAGSRSSLAGARRS